MIANALVLITAGFPPRNRGLALGIWGAASGVAVGIGLALAGYLVQYVSWRAIFWVNAPFLLVVVLVGMRVLRELERSGRGRGFDLLGGALLAVGVGSLLLALTDGQVIGWGDRVTIALFVLAAAGTVGFLLWEPHARDALLPLDLIRTRAYAMAAAAIFMQSIVFFGIFLLLPIYLQSLQGRSPLETGIMLLPLSLALIVFSPLAGRLSSTIGPRPPTLVGLLLIAGSMAGLAQITLNSPYLALAALLAVAGAGIGLSISPLTSTAMTAASADQRGSASGFFNLLRFVGAVLGTTILSVTLTNRTQAAQLAGVTGHMLALQHGFHDVYLVAGAFALAGAVVALWLRPAQNT